MVEAERTRETLSSSPCRPPRSSSRFSSPAHYRECRHRHRRCSRSVVVGSGGIDDWESTTTPTTTGPRPPPAIAPRPERRARDVAVRCPGGGKGEKNANAASDDDAAATDDDNGDDRRKRGATMEAVSRRVVVQRRIGGGRGSLFLFLLLK